LPALSEDLTSFEKRSGLVWSESELKDIGELEDLDCDFILLISIQINAIHFKLENKNG